MKKQYIQLLFLVLCHSFVHTIPKDKEKYLLIERAKSPDVSIDDLKKRIRSFLTKYPGQKKELENNLTRSSLVQDKKNIFTEVIQKFCTDALTQPIISDIPTTPTIPFYSRLPRTASEQAEYIEQTKPYSSIAALNFIAAFTLPLDQLTSE